ncbi:MAG TPA: GAF and ANTAR domain-containing protein [Nocardioides sp.]|nr:GAF and ANTAR domain-containing protein [Nocardioides sp.]
MESEHATAGADLPQRGEREGQMSRAFVSLADTLVEDYDPIEMLNRLVAHCVALLAADAAAIMLADSAGGGLRSVASSSEQADLMDTMQLQAEQGPCVECFATSAPVNVADLNREHTRWPRFIPAVIAHGAYRSVHAVPLHLRGRPIGALNLFHCLPGSLPKADLELAHAFADVATIGILSERALHDAHVLNTQLQTALNSRVIIEQAKGVLAAYGQISMDAAFIRVRHYARSHNQRLAEVARQIATCELAPMEVL